MPHEQGVALSHHLHAVPEAGQVGMPNLAEPTDVGGVTHYFLTSMRSDLQTIVSAPAPRWFASRV
jgi:hypothetical protein